MFQLYTFFGMKGKRFIPQLTQWAFSLTRCKKADELRYALSHRHHRGAFRRAAGARASAKQRKRPASLPARAGYARGDRLDAGAEPHHRKDRAVKKQPIP